MLALTLPLLTGDSRTGAAEFTAGCAFEPFVKAYSWVLNAGQFARPERHITLMRLKIKHHEHQSLQLPSAEHRLPLLHATLIFVHPDMCWVVEWSRLAALAVDPQ
jgi:hypothetical protein